MSSSDEFLFTPSLIWVPFGKRSRADITFKVGPTFEEHGVDFVHAEATEIDPVARRVQTTAGPQDYDYLVIATGLPQPLRGDPRLGPGRQRPHHHHDGGRDPRGEGWTRFRRDPGDVVIGATQGAGCFGAAYEFLFTPPTSSGRPG